MFHRALYGDMLCGVLLTFNRFYMRGFVFALVIFVCGSIDAQVALDKQRHYAAGVVTATTGYGITLRMGGDRRRARWVGFVTCVMVGVAKETLDVYRPGAGFDVRDLGATVLGGASFVVTDRVLEGQKRKFKF